MYSDNVPLDQSLLMDSIIFFALFVYPVEYLENNTILNEAISEIALPTVRTFQVPSLGGRSEKVDSTSHNAAQLMHVQ